MLQRSPNARAAVLVLVSLAGCASGGHASYRALASDYAALDLQTRETRARVEQLLEGPELDRRALIRAVLARNPSVESSRQAWRAALARYRRAGAYEDPMLKLALAPLSIAATNTRFGFEVGISQHIPLGGKLAAQATLAAAEAETQRSDFKDTRLRLALAASQLYDDYFVAVRSLEIQAQHLDLIDAMKESAAAAYAAGRAAAQDSLQTEVERARLEYQNTVYETDRDVAIAQLNALLHRAPDAPLPPPPTDPGPNDVDAEPNTDELARTLERRPDIAGMRARVHVAQAQAAAAESDYFPDLVFETSYNSMWEMPAHRWMAGVGLSLPLERGRRHAASDEAVAVRASAASAVQSMTDVARGEVAVATRRLDQARRAVQLYEQRLVPLARERIEAARAGFVTSQTSFSALIEAEHSLRAAELELQMVRADLNRRRAELDRALGRVPGFDGAEAAP